MSKSLQTGQPNQRSGSKGKKKLKKSSINQLKMSKRHSIQSQIGGVTVPSLSQPSVTGPQQTLKTEASVAKLSSMREIGGSQVAAPPSSKNADQVNRQTSFNTISSQG